MIDLCADAFFDEGIFAQPATYVPVSGVAATIPVIFDNEYSAPSDAGIVAVSSSAPIVTCRTSDVSSASRGDTLTLTVDEASVTFNVTEVMHEGNGFTTLRLSRD